MSPEGGRYLSVMVPAGGPRLNLVLPPLPDPAVPPLEVEHAAEK